MPTCWCSRRPHFNEFPDLQVTDVSFRELRKVSDANPQKSKLVWGTAELFHYRNSDGVPLASALYKPENFDPKKEISADRLHLRASLAKCEPLRSTGAKSQHQHFLLRQQRYL